MATEIMLSQQALKGPPFFTRGFCRVSDVTLIRSEQFGQVTALEGLNRSALRVTQRSGSWDNFITGRGQFDIVGFKSPRTAEREGPGDDTFQFTDISRPRISH